MEANIVGNGNEGRFIGDVLFFRPYGAAQRKGQIQCLVGPIGVQRSDDQLGSRFGGNGEKCRMKVDRNSQEIAPALQLGQAISLTLWGTLCHGYATRHTEHFSDIRWFELYRCAVLAGHGDEAALWFEGDRWDQSQDGGRGAPVVSYSVSRKKLLLEVARCALALRDVGLKAGDRIAINMPNIPEQVFWTEACKRLGIVYTPVFGGFSDKTLSDRIHNAGARIVITADGGYRNAQIVAFKEAYTDPALDGYVPAETAVAAVAAALASLRLDAVQSEAILAGARQVVANEITLERSDIMRGVGRALEGLSGISPVEADRKSTRLNSSHRT